jgi:hypothetical protein
MKRVRCVCVCVCVSVCVVSVTAMYIWWCENEYFGTQYLERVSDTLHLLMHATTKTRMRLRTQPPSPLLVALWHNHYSWLYGTTTTRGSVAQPQLMALWHNHSSWLCGTTTAHGSVAQPLLMAPPLIHAPATRRSQQPRSTWRSGRTL